MLFCRVTANKRVNVGYGGDNSLYIIKLLIKIAVLLFEEVQSLKKDDVKTIQELTKVKQI